jgi:hypothetical protein
MYLTFRSGTLAVSLAGFTIDRVTLDNSQIILR